MDTLKPTLRTRIHEWLADHVSWIQYPERQHYRKVDDNPHRGPGSRLIWLLVLVPVPILFTVPIVLAIYLGVMYTLYLRSLSE